MCRGSKGAGDRNGGRKRRKGQEAGYNKACVKRKAAQTPQSRQMCDPRLMVTAYLAEPALREANE